MSLAKDQGGEGSRWGRRTPPIEWVVASGRARSSLAWPGNAPIAQKPTLVCIERHARNPKRWLCSQAARSLLNKFWGHVHRVKKGRQFHRFRRVQQQLFVVEPGSLPERVVGGMGECVDGGRCARDRTPLREHISYRFEKDAVKHRRCWERRDGSENTSTLVMRKHP